MAITVGWLRDGDEAVRNDLSGQAFGHVRAFDPDHALPNDQIMAAYDGGELVASAALLEGGHWFGGRPVPGPGVSGVSVAAHRRGRGIAKELLAPLLHAIHERGGVVSSLYPTAAPLYRWLGYELAGERVGRRIDVAALRAPTVAGVRIERLEPGALASMASTYDSLARQGSGWIARGDRWWWHRRRMLDQHAVRNYLYTLEVDGHKGYVALDAAPADREIFDLAITDLGATSPEVLRAIGGLISGFGAVADRVTAHHPPWVLEALTEQGHRWAATTGQGWMLRLVDAASAVAARGWAPVDVSVALEVIDPHLAHNHGPFVLSAAEGHASLEPGGPGTWQFPITALAAWFSGWRSASQLAWLGEIDGTGPREELSALDALAAGPAPVIPEFY